MLWQIVLWYLYVVAALAVTCWALRGVRRGGG
jgi:hypothetical protein